MAQPTTLTFSRLVVADPQINAAIQDIYNKFGQVQAQLTVAQQDIVTLKAQVKALQNP